jgi:cytochrome c-type biogenesis protein CcmH
MLQPTKVIRTLFLALATTLLFALAMTALAQEPSRKVSDDEVNEVAKQLYCPICESTPLDVCATQACADWREVIRTKLGEGETAQEIIDYFELQYGPRALAEPPRTGAPLAVWILPILAVVVGAFIFVRYMRTLRAAQAGAGPIMPEFEPQPPSPDAGEKPAADDDYRSRIESELRDM